MLVVLFYLISVRENQIKIGTTLTTCVTTLSQRRILTRAFDSVSRKLLIMKLSCYPIVGPLIWFRIF